MRLLLLLALISCGPSKSPFAISHVHINILTGTINNLVFYEYTPQTITALLGPPTHVVNESSHSRDDRSIGGGFITTYTPLALDYPARGLSFFFTHTKFDKEQHLEQLAILVDPSEHISPGFRPFEGELTALVDSTSTRDYLLMNIPGAKEMVDIQWYKPDSGLARSLGAPNFGQANSVFIEVPTWVKAANYTKFSFRTIESKHGMITFEINSNSSKLQAIRMVALPITVTVVSPE
jgi:hypothetical protein